MGCNSSTASGPYKRGGVKVPSPSAVVVSAASMQSQDPSLKSYSDDSKGAQRNDHAATGKPVALSTPPPFSLLFRRSLCDSTAKGAGAPSQDDAKRYQWELAQIEEISGHVIRILLTSNEALLRYLIDCSRPEVMHICGTSLLSEEQRRSGAALTPEQAVQTRQFLRDSLSISVVYNPGALRFHSLINDVDYSSLVGREVSCRDEFVSKRSGQLMHKWREAAIVDCVQSYLKLHFHGWSSKHDLWLDFDTDDIAFVAEKSTLSQEQMSNGTELNESQLKRTVKIFRPVLPFDIELNKISSQGGESPLTNATNTSAKNGALKTTMKSVSPMKSSNALKSNMDSMTVSKNSYEGSSKSAKRSRRASFDPGVIDTYNRVRPLTSEKSSRVVEFNPEAPRAIQSSPKMFNNLSSPSSKGLKSLTTTSTLKIPGNGDGDCDGRLSGPETQSAHYVSPIATAPVDTSSGRGEQELVSLRGASSRRVVQDDTDTEVDADGSKTPNISMRKYLHQRTQSFPASYADNVTTERAFIEAMSHHGLHVFQVEGDGNCLFRAVAHQIWFDQNRHEELRSLCVRHMWKHKQRFSVFCEGDFSNYILRMAESGTWADDIEIRALEELLDRLINIYDVEGSEIKPMNKSFDEDAKFSSTADNNPIILSYHGKNHYNSVFDEKIELPLPMKTTNYLMRLRILHFCS